MNSRSWRASAHCLTWKKWHFHTGFGISFITKRIVHLKMKILSSFNLMLFQTCMTLFHRTQKRNSDCAGWSFPFNYNERATKQKYHKSGQYDSCDIFQPKHVPDQWVSMLKPDQSDSWTNHQREILFFTQSYGLLKSHFVWKIVFFNSFYVSPAFLCSTQHEVELLP